MLWKIFARMPSNDPKNPDFADVCYQRDIIAIGWGSEGNLARFSTRATLKQALRRMDYRGDERKLANHAGSIWAFLHKVKKGDLVICPDREAGVWYVGKVQQTSPYFVSRPTDGCWFEHRRRVKWTKRRLVKRELLRVLGAKSVGGIQTCAKVLVGESRLRAWLGPVSPARPARHGRGGGSGGGGTPDREWGVEVEQRAKQWIKENWGSPPKDVSHTACGWDLEHGAWKIEVKGRKTRATTIRLSFNEWQAAKKHDKNYMLMVFTAASNRVLRKSKPVRRPDPTQLLDWHEHPEYWLIEE